jgi:penicillin-binding protein 2
VGYAPFDDPEIVVLAFVYNGTEGAAVAAPIVGKVMQAYFALNSIDTSEEILE